MVLSALIYGIVFLTFRLRGPPIRRKDITS